MNKVKRFLIGGAVGTVMLGSLAFPAFAHEGYSTCQGFGEGVIAAFATAEGGVGEPVRDSAPLNDDVAELHAFVCTPT